jgi:hypothetical protein
MQVETDVAEHTLFGGVAPDAGVSGDGERPGPFADRRGWGQDRLQLLFPEISASRVTRLAHTAWPSLQRSGARAYVVLFRQTHPEIACKNALC